MSVARARASVSLCASLTAASLFIASSRVFAATIAVPPGGDLQSALNTARPGDTIVLTPGATYVGNFVLPATGGASTITIETDPSGLPGDGVRISPRSTLAVLRSPNGMPALVTAPGAHHWRLALLEFQANQGGIGDIIELGDGSSAQSLLSQVPHDLVVDRCYIHGDPTTGQKRGIALNSASTTITASYISDIKAVGQDSQTIAGWNGPGPFTIANNYLEAAGENILFGGADPWIANLIPSDITITGNVITKQTAWRSQGWQVKNLVELKNALRVEIAGNTIEYNWEAAQIGFAILFTVRNQDGTCPWCQVANVTFERNVVRHTAAGVSILGYDDNYPSQQTHAIAIRNNVFWDVDNQNWGGNGYFLLLTGGPRDITVDHNTVIQNHAYGLMQLDGAPILNFTYTNNLARQNAYGITGTNHSPGNDSIAAYLPGSSFAMNVIADGNPSLYPSGNLFPTSSQFDAQFVSYAGDDYHLAAASAWCNAGTDGQDLGMLWNAHGASPSFAWQIAGTGDFDGDGKADVVWRQTATGDVLVSLMDGSIAKQASLVAQTVSLDWQIVGVGDFNGDGKADLLWRQAATGDVAIWFLNGAAVQSVPVVATGVPLAWRIVGVGDLDGDGKTDLVWRQTQTGDVAVWLMDGATVRSIPVIASGVPTTWRISAIGDLDGDGKADLVWRHGETGAVAVWLMDGTTVRSIPVIAAGVPLPWQIAGVADVDGDGKADILWRHGQTGDVAAWLMDGSTVSRIPVVASGVALQWQTVSAADLNGDGKADLLWRNTQTSAVSVWFMNGPAVQQTSAVTATLP